MPTAAPADEIGQLEPPDIREPYLANYVAATVELAALKQARPPGWTSGVAPLDEPVFGAPWLSLRAHLPSGIARAIPQAQHFHRFEYRRAGLMLSSERTPGTLPGLSLRPGIRNSPGRVSAASSTSRVAQ